MNAPTPPTDWTPARLPAAELARMLANAAAFAGDTTAPPILRAVRVRAGDGQLSVEATDRYTLIRETHPLQGSAGAFDVVLPLPGVRQIRHLLAAAGRLPGQAAAQLAVVGEVTVSRAGREPVTPRLRIAAGDMAVEAAGEPGDFPNLDDLIAREDALAATHDPAPFDVTLAPRLLARLAKIRTGDGGRQPRARLSQPNGEPSKPGGPVMRPVHATLGERVRVMVMPVCETQP
jgi:hypothetical protein